MAEPRDSMMARWSHIQSALFPWMREELDPLTEGLERLIHVLATIRLEAFVPPPPSGGRGRKPEDRRALARGFVAKAMLGIPTTIALIERLAVDQSLRRICGWEKRREVPSEGYKTSWTGYKLHIDVADGQIPVCCLLTSASVHDSQSLPPRRRGWPSR